MDKPLKDNPLTKDDLLDTLAEFYSGQIKPDLENLRNDLKSEIAEVKKELKSEISEVKKDIAKVDQKVSWLRDDVKGLEGELSSKASKKEVNELKTRVNSYQPTN